MYGQSVVFDFDVRQCAIGEDDGVGGEVTEGRGVEVYGLGVAAFVEGGVAEVFQFEAFRGGFFGGFGGGEIGYVVGVLDGAGEGKVFRVGGCHC